MEHMLQVLNIIDTIKGKFKSDHIANILAGVKSSAVRSYNHHNFKEFGSGSDNDTKFWNAVIRQGLISRLIIKEIENYGLLSLSKKGIKFFDNPFSIMLTKDHNYDQMDEKQSSSGGTGVVDPELFSLIKDLRKKISKDKNIPPFVIFNDPSLEDMAIQYPITSEEMQNITGVGVGKAQRYGDEFAELIKKYVEEKEIERPLDMVVKSVVNKSVQKVYIIQSIDRKMSLNDIAGAKNMGMNDLLKEIEAIVHSGTRINIDYYINEVMDQEHQDEVYGYFREDAETESIDDALDELGEDEYTEEDIRLIRIKFLSEMGN